MIARREPNRDDSDDYSDSELEEDISDDENGDAEHENDINMDDHDETDEDGDADAETKRPPKKMAKH